MFHAAVSWAAFIVREAVQGCLLYGQQLTCRLGRVCIFISMGPWSE